MIYKVDRKWVVGKWYPLGALVSLEMWRELKELGKQLNLDFQEATGLRGEIFFRLVNRP